MSGREPRRSAWSALADEWDPDHPAVRRGRDALLLGREPAPPEPKPPKVELEPEPEPIVPEPVKRDSVAELVARVRAGDLSAAHALRRLLDR